MFLLAPDEKTEAPRRGGRNEKKETEAPIPEGVEKIARRDEKRATLRAPAENVPEADEHAEKEDSE
jgi:hypothetical protein